MKTILVVDDNKLNLATARTVLSGNSNYRVIPVMKGQQALTYLETGECDIILLDINMPEMDGFEVLERIHAMEGCRNIPVIFLTADDDAETETRCFKEGAVDFIAKPFVPEVMLSRIGRALELEELRQSLADRLEQKTREVNDLEITSQQDALTGLWDRAYTEESVNGLLEQGCAGALMMMDIDNFKSVNDSYGHAAGDEMLKLVAATLQRSAREGDILCRLGGDEFVVFIKDVSGKTPIRDRASTIIADLHEQIEAMHYSVNTSISIGIAQTPGDGTDFATLYSCADKALYYVKRNGKNAYHFFGERLDENGPGQDVIDLNYLQEIMNRIDNGRGAYLLNLESFRYVYNYIRRFVDRTDREVSSLLFTLTEGSDPRAMELLEKIAGTFLRRSDFAAQYSGKQLIVVLVEVSDQDVSVVAERIVDRFCQIYTGDPVRLEYSIAKLESRLEKA